MFTFLGIVATIIAIKFIYDNFITNNANKNWEKYKSECPEEAARVERNTGLNINTKPITNEVHKLASLQMLAEFYECKASDVKDVVMNDFKINYPNSEELNNIIEKFKTAKGSDSIKYNIDPEDTPHAYLYNWALELRNSVILENQISLMFKLPREAGDSYELSESDKEITMELRNHLEDDMAKSIFELIESYSDYFHLFFKPMLIYGIAENFIFNTLLILYYSKDYNSILEGKVRHKVMALSINHLTKYYNLPKPKVISVFTEREKEFRQEFEMMKDPNYLPIKFYKNLYTSPFNLKLDEVSLGDQASIISIFESHLKILTNNLWLEFNKLEDANPDFKTTCIV